MIYAFTRTQLNIDNQLTPINVKSHIQDVERYYIPHVVCMDSSKAEGGNHFVLWVCVDCNANVIAFNV